MRRALALLLALLLALVVLAGCGGDPGDKALKGRTPEQVVSGWAKVTGERLGRSGAPTDDWTELRLPAASDAAQRVGVFSIFVLKRQNGADALLKDKAKGEELVVQGPIVWRRTTDGGSWSAARRFGANVVVRWQGTEQRRTDATFTRLVQTVSAALSGDVSKLPAEDRPCKAAGIDPARGREGTCRLDKTVLTVVNAGSELRTPVLNARVTAVRSAKVVPASSQFGRPDRAKGRYVIVTYRLDNPGDRPIDFLNTTLVLDGKAYARDFKPEYNLYGGDNPLPAQPGDTVTVKDAFDVPETVAQRADEAALALPAGRLSSGSTLDDSQKQGRIRLVGAPKGATPSGSSGGGGGGGGSVDGDLTFGDGGGSGGTSSSARASAPEKALRQFFTAIRKRDIRTVCARVSKRFLRTLGGVSGCRRTRVVNLSAADDVPPGGSKPRFTTTVFRNGTRALILVRAKGYRGTVGMSRESGRWRVRGLVKK